MNKLTKSIGQSQSDHNFDIGNKQPKKILITRPNGRLGNLLLITPLMQDISAAFPGCKIDLFVKGSLAPAIFKNYYNVDHITQLPGKPFKNLLKYVGGWLAIRKSNYDIVINVNKNSSSGRLSTMFAKGDFKFFGDSADGLNLKYRDYRHIAKFPVYNFREFFKLNLDRHIDVPAVNLKLDAFEIAAGKKVLDNLFGNNKETICIFTHATGAKSYSETWWEAFYQKLLDEFPNYNIIEILPIENISKISFKAKSFYSNDIRKLGSLIANTRMFIGADSGLMHLASSVQTTTIGLFSVTDPNVYQPYQNQSIAIDTNQKDINAIMAELHNILALKPDVFLNNQANF